MNISPEIKALNRLVGWFDELTQYQHDTWSLPEILAWFDALDWAKKGKDSNEH